MINIIRNTNSKIISYKLLFVFTYRPAAYLSLDHNNVVGINRNNPFNIYP